MLLAWGLSGAWATVALAAAASEVEIARLIQRATELQRLRGTARERGDLPLGPIRDSILRTVDSLEAAVGVPPRPETDSLMCLLLRQAGDSSIRLDDDAAAMACYSRAVAVADRSGLPKLVAESRIGLSKALAADDRLETALALLQEVLPLAERLDDSRPLGACLADIGQWHASLGRLNEAEAATDRALAIYEAGGWWRHWAAAAPTKSWLLHHAGREVEALAVADSGLARGTRGRATLHALSRLHVARANALEGLDRIDDALAALDQASEMDRRSDNVQHLRSTAFVRTNVLLRAGRHEECLRYVRGLRLDPEMELEPRFEVRLSSVEGVALANAGRFDDAETVSRAALARFEARRDSLEDERSQVGLFLRGGELYATLARCALARGDAIGAWSWAERGRASVLRARLETESQQPDAALLPSIQAHLRRASAALIQFNERSRNPLLAFVLTADSLQAIELGHPDVERDAETALALLAGNASDDACAASLERLSAAVWAPVVASIEPSVTRIYLIPPSELLAFPFETLASGGASTGDRFALSYLPSASTLLHLAARAPAAAGMCVVADPWIPQVADRPRAEDEHEGSAVSRVALPAARREARAVAVRDADVLVGRDATEARVFDAAHRDVAVLHFATHALIDPRRPERSGLLLAGDDDLFTAAEMESLELRADLVTLSGCRTSSGYQVVGEGSLGLQRSLLIAGARSVVTSLWDVEDEAAARFMAFFYDGLRRGLPRDESLRSTRAEMRRLGASHRDRSAFQLTGLGDAPVAALAAAPGQGLAPFATESRSWLAAGAGALVVTLLLFLRRRRDAGRSGAVDK